MTEGGDLSVRGMRSIHLLRPRGGVARFDSVGIPEDADTIFGSDACPLPARLRSQQRYLTRSR